MVHIRPQETVDSALRLSGLAAVDRENAAIHGVAIKTIRRWRGLYQRRGLPRGQFCESRCPRCDGAELDESAYAHLLGGISVTVTLPRLVAVFSRWQLPTMQIM